MTSTRLDLRQLARSQGLALAVGRYGELAVGDALVVTDDQDPRQLRSELDLEYPRSHGWEYLESGPELWRIRISKLGSTPLPRVLCEPAAVVAAAAADAAGAVWKLPMRTRALDANLVQLPPFGTIDAHVGPDLDVLVHVIGGAGLLTTELDVLALTAGSLVWLPRRSERGFTAAAEGLQYLTVHQRRQGLSLTAST